MRSRCRAGRPRCPPPFIAQTEAAAGADLPQWISVTAPLSASSAFASACLFEQEPSDHAVDQRFGSAANLNIHLHCLVLDGIYQRGTDGEPVFSCDIT